mgnify:CR=1 FL=1|jgi:hypothetical protein
MSKVYVLLYIHTDKVEYSEVLGVYTSRTKAVDELLERANYRQNNGILTQYMKPTTEYESFDVLRTMVEDKMELYDVDIYRIEVHKLL